MKQDHEVNMAEGFSSESRMHVSSKSYEDLYSLILNNQNSVDKLIRKLDSRIGDIEKILNEDSKFNVISDAVTSDHDSIYPTAPQTLTDENLGKYMDSAINDQGWDEEISEDTYELARGVVDNISNLVVDSMKCIDSYCQAKFFSEDGKNPSLDDIWGHPPFMNEGFTVPQEDGSILLYFTQENSEKSISDIRGIASAE